MIKDHDRSYYIGASDTGIVLRSWNTVTFEKWYLEKLGLRSSCFSNDAMKAGTAYEHRILDSLGLPNIEKDKQIIIGRLRVNLDGNTDDTIYEVKTYKSEKEFKVSKSYKNQVLVQMYASGLRKACIVSYGLTFEDYDNFFRDIELDRIHYHPIQYDPGFLSNVYLPRLHCLERCLNEGIFPKEEYINEFCGKD